MVEYASWLTGDSSSVVDCIDRGGLGMEVRFEEGW
jgi:hypothetical protein